VTKSLNTALIKIHQNYNDAIAVNHMKQWVKDGQHPCVLDWLQTMVDEMQTLVDHFYGSIPDTEPPYLVHQLIQLFKIANVPVSTGHQATEHVQ